jgi:hypothetical protein
MDLDTVDEYFEVLGVPAADNDRIEVEQHFGVGNVSEFVAIKARCAS